MATKLFAPVDKDGSFEPPSSVEFLIQELDGLFEQGEIPDADLGAYLAIVTLMATPAVMLQSKMEAMLEEVYENTINDMDYIMEKAAKNTKKDNATPETTVVRPIPSVTVEETTEESEDSATDIVEEPDNLPEWACKTTSADGIPKLHELNTWYTKTQGVIIQGWNNANYEYKLKEYNTFMATAEGLNKDLTDEELLESFAKPTTAYSAY